MARGYHNVEYCVTIKAWVRSWDGHLPEFQSQTNAMSTWWTYQAFLQSCDTGSKHKHCMCNRVLGDGSLPDGFWPWEPEAEGNILLFPSSFTIPKLAFLWSSSELLTWILLLSIVPRLPVFTNNRASSVTTLSNWSMHQANAILQHDPCLISRISNVSNSIFYPQAKLCQTMGRRTFLEFLFQKSQVPGIECLARNLRSCWDSVP
jgi:hypothetical protein